MRHPDVFDHPFKNCIRERAAKYPDRPDFRRGLNSCLHLQVSICSAPSPFPPLPSPRSLFPLHPFAPPLPFLPLLLPPSSHYLLPFLPSPPPPFSPPSAASDLHSVYSPHPIFIPSLALLSNGPSSTSFVLSPAPNTQFPAHRMPSRLTQI